MKTVLLAACFLFFCHAPVHHRHGQRPTSCDTILSGFHDSWGNQDDFVSGFPIDEQHRVLVCLDKLAKKQGRQG